MYNTLKRLYLTDKLTEKGLKNAVIKKWITEEEMNKILESK